jgi:hypothetical protein
MVLHVLSNGAACAQQWCCMCSAMVLHVLSNGAAMVLHVLSGPGWAESCQLSEHNRCQPCTMHHGTMRHACKLQRKHGALAFKHCCGTYHLPKCDVT